MLSTPRSIRTVIVASSLAALFACSATNDGASEDARSAGPDGKTAPGCSTSTIAPRGACEIPNARAGVPLSVQIRVPQLGGCLTNVRCVVEPAGAGFHLYAAADDCSSVAADAGPTAACPELAPDDRVTCVLGELAEGSYELYFGPAGEGPDPASARLGVTAGGTGDSCELWAPGVASAVDLTGYSRECEVAEDCVAVGATASCACGCDVDAIAKTEASRYAAAAQVARSRCDVGGPSPSCAACESRVPACSSAKKCEFVASPAL